MMELDAFVVVNVINHGRVSDTYFDMVISDCISLLKNILEIIQSSFCKDQRIK